MFKGRSDGKLADQPPNNQEYLEMTYYNITITHITSKVIRIFDKK